MKSTELKTELITHLINEYLGKYINPNQKNRILVGFSAGPDSTCLLDNLYRLKSVYNLEIICAYYNHGLRDETELEKELETAEKNCIHRGIILIIGKDDGCIKKEAGKLGIEGAARKYRYNFLKKTMKELDCNYLALGHNRDDQTETVVMRFFSGSGAEGLKGIPEINESIIRPMINCSKKQILNYLNKNSINYSYDLTNKNSIYLRNKIRNNLLENIRVIFPGYEKSLTALSEKMDMTEKFIQNEVSERIIWKEIENGYQTDYFNFTAQPEIIRLGSLYAIFNRMIDEEDLRIPYSFFKPLLKTNFSSIKSNLLLKGYGLKLFRTRGLLFLKRDIVIKNEKSYPLYIENEKRIYPIGKNRYIYIVNRKQSECTEKDLWLDPESVKGRLYIRFREEGDRISLRGGSKKLKKLYNDMGVQQDLKDRIPLICDDSGILAVIGSAYGYQDRISSKIFENNKPGKNVIVFGTRQV